MKFVDEFRDPEAARVLVSEIKKLASAKASEKEPIVLMEFCGGHTHTIFRYGIEQLLPKSIEMVHGPGCPVCVLPMGRVDDCISLAQNKNVILTTFGDAMRVPGSQKSLLQAKTDGADIRMVYSPLDALALAEKHPDKEVIFFALGFETTMPSTALTVLQAEKDGIENFSLFCNHITTVPIVKALLDSPDMNINAFLAPGHVSMVVGETPFKFVAQHYQKPIVITGFEPIDILQSIWMLVKQIAEGRAELENQYSRVVARNGNSPGMEALAKVFEPREFFEWRGLGSIDQSGVKLKDEYSKYDAEKKFSIPNLRVADPKDCQCGEVLKGLIKPWQCKLFGNSCIPKNPMGALMVSSEGACAAYFKFGNFSGGTEEQKEVLSK
ncbi:MAG: hydrogenase formation protein HypD [Candidatus Obscuribacterales bacterium]|nr:hydrogenase formation protein HypD [Candidatus Obscuribacterales bacterium]